jgi:hypothetical protein
MVGWQLHFITAIPQELKSFPDCDKIGVHFLSKGNSNARPASGN